MHAKGYNNIITSAIIHTMQLPACMYHQLVASNLKSWLISDFAAFIAACKSATALDSIDVTETSHNRISGVSPT